ncbi:helix-turn-helix transcriptional regulator [Cellulomonas sp. Sa3CUA2]|uniref:Helix-turn-helix transcriptional regulator n=1 Tax=Cellulomonas avistercoris TaxID=2762242 RepID=A0ABR8QB70_9CELL|nr:PadR family transcriptional regulator [Cellulomonas avistercoris]MBD7917660.1 helix-turn-helix transcriptional regulator [Cellulomonas avistercoris]
MVQVFAHGQLRLYLLALLEDGPRHGYELITALSDRFGGTYRPSAGTVYPRLARLEEEGLVRRSDEGRKATYTLTDAGRAVLDERRGDLAHLEAEISETVRAQASQVRDDVQAAMRGLRADLASAAQRARDAATPVSGAPDPQRTASHRRRVEAEAVVRRFGDEVRADLRRADAAAGVDELTVETLRTVLDTALRTMRSTLR